MILNTTGTPMYKGEGKISPQNHHFLVILGVTFLLADFQQCLRRERYLSRKERLPIFVRLTH